MASCQTSLIGFVKVGIADQYRVFEAGLLRFIAKSDALQRVFLIRSDLFRDLRSLDSFSACNLSLNYATILLCCIMSRIGFCQTWFVGPPSPIKLLPKRDAPLADALPLSPNLVSLSPCRLHTAEEAVLVSLHLDSLVFTDWRERDAVLSGSIGFPSSRTPLQDEEGLATEK